MPLPLLLLRPQPGNDASAVRARERGLSVIQLPLFETAPVERGPVPQGRFDALLLTSASAARFAPDLLAHFAGLPVYAVGEASARAARENNAGPVKLGGGDAAGTAEMIACDGHRHVLHLCGADVRAFAAPGLLVERHIVYRAQERDAAAVQPALDALDGAVAAIHSPRAGARLAALLAPPRRGSFSLAAISAQAGAACGVGWAALDIAAAPVDTALLACAETLCIQAG